MSNTLPTYPLFEVRETPSSGRGVVAMQDIPAETPLLQTSMLPAWVIVKAYKREVCAQCFIYQRGRNLKIRDPETGHSFCSSGCQDVWMKDAGPLGVEAWKAVEGFIRRKSTQHKNGVGNGKGDEDVDLPDATTDRPTEEDIRTAWDAIRGTAHFILEARNGSSRKPHRRALQAVLATPPYPDILCFLLAATIARAIFEVPTTTETTEVAATEWETLMQLVPDTTPYASSLDLAIAIQSHLHLLALLPVQLLPYVTPEAHLTLAERDSHNSFGIRSLDDDGDEFLGYGVWPLASFFNHSCSPNVAKRRVGRAWEFWTNQKIEEGEEVCISYMGGDEVDLQVVERRDRLRGTWVFECGCERCGLEDLKDVEVMDGVEVVLENLVLGKDLEK